MPTHPRRPLLSDPSHGQPRQPIYSQQANSSSAPSWCTARGLTCLTGSRLPGPPPLQVGMVFTHDSHHLLVTLFIFLHGCVGGQVLKRSAFIFRRSISFRNKIINVKRGFHMLGFHLLVRSGKVQEVQGKSFCHMLCRKQETKKSG